MVPQCPQKTRKGICEYPASLTAHWPIKICVATECIRINDNDNSTNGYNNNCSRYWQLICTSLTCVLFHVTVSWWWGRSLVWLLISSNARSTAGRTPCPTVPEPAGFGLNSPAIISSLFFLSIVCPLQVQVLNSKINITSFICTKYGKICKTEYMNYFQQNNLNLDSKSHRFRVLWHILVSNNHIGTRRTRPISEWYFFRVPHLKQC